MHDPGGLPGRPTRRFSFRALRRRGQSLTEFALVLPVLMLIVLIGLDFGRVFLGWVGLNNAVRVGANYAAQNPTAWDVGNPNAAKIAEYNRLITAETQKIGCTMPGTIPSPTFPGGTDIGSPANVAITCGFGIMTPLVSALLPNPLPVTSAAAFPVRAGSIAGVPAGTLAPYPTPTPSPTPTPTPTPTPDPTDTPEPTPEGQTPSPSPSPSPTPSPSPSPTPPTCVVPNMGGPSAQAQNKWTGAGFLTNVIFSPLVPPNYTVTRQSLNAGTVLLCAATTITVQPAP